MAKGKREQTQNAESVVNTRQDRSTFLTDGGTWAWAAGTGTLSWSASAVISRPGRASDTVSAGSVVGLTAAGNSVYVDVDRAGSGALSILGGTTPGPATDVSASANETDERILLGTRGVDGRFYFRNGTVFADGDSKTFGTVNAATDRADTTATGGATDTVPFSYVVGSSQLAVYVGGLLMQLGTHYTEDDTTTVGWTTLGQPATGELLTFVNIVGGQGPAGGTGSLQSAYDTARFIEVTSLTGANVQVWSSVAPSSNVWPAVLGWGDGVSAVNGILRADGSIALATGEAGLSFLDNAATGIWYLVPDDDGGSGLLLFHSTSGEGVRILENGAFEHGAYTSGHNAYPGGGWTPDGAGGGLKWALFTGTIDGAGADELIATGLSNIVDVSISVGDSNRGGVNAFDMAVQQFSNKRIAAFFDAATGDVVLSGNLAQSSAIGSHLWGEAYTLTVFYQG